MLSSSSTSMSISLLRSFEMSRMSSMCKNQYILGGFRKKLVRGLLMGLAPMIVCEWMNTSCQQNCLLKIDGHGNISIKPFLLQAMHGVMQRFKCDAIDEMYENLAEGVASVEENKFISAFMSQHKADVLKKCKQEVYDLLIVMASCSDLDEHHLQFKTLGDLTDFIKMVTDSTFYELYECRGEKQDNVLDAVYGQKHLRLLQATLIQVTMESFSPAKINYDRNELFNSRMYTVVKSIAAQFPECKTFCDFVETVEARGTRHTRRNPAPLGSDMDLSSPVNTPQADLSLSRVNLAAGSPARSSGRQVTFLHAMYISHRCLWVYVIQIIPRMTAREARRRNYAHATTQRRAETLPRPSSTTQRRAETLPRPSPTTQRRRSRSKRKRSSRSTTTQRRQRQSSSNQRRPNQQYRAPTDWYSHDNRPPTSAWDPDLNIVASLLDTISSPVPSHRSDHQRDPRLQPSTRDPLDPVDLTELLADLQAYTPRQ